MDNNTFSAKFKKKFERFLSTLNLNILSEIKGYGCSIEIFPDFNQVIIKRKGQNLFTQKILVEKEKHIEHYNINSNWNFREENFLPSREDISLRDCESRFFSVVELLTFPQENENNWVVITIQIHNSKRIFTCIKKIINDKEFYVAYRNDLVPILLLDENYMIVEKYLQSY